MWGLSKVIFLLPWLLMSLTGASSTELYIVAIGGSAGSLEPLKSFFGHTPLDSASYVIIRHLPQDYQSHLKVLLDRYSRLPIVEVRGGEIIAPNTVYIGPAHQHMVIRNKKLHVVERHHGPNRAIDLFLHSLASEQLENKAIAVILSGAGFDGVKGASAIKAAGGWVIAQDPVTCELDTMPRYTINSGAADQALAPSDMPAAIQAYVQANKTTK
jgi:two-component system CheB/CheR fusion protein